VNALRARRTARNFRRPEKQYPSREGGVLHVKEEMNRLRAVLERPMAAMAAVLMILLLVPSAWAQTPLRADEVVVTASRMPEPREQSTSNVIVITEQDIERTGAEFLPEVLSKVTDINLIQSGGPGTAATIQLRGASSDQVVVMIDGVKVKSTTLGYYDLAGIRAEDIARIEIVKGPQSTMYGSEAMAGVINIITKKGKPGFTVGGSYEYGSFKTRRGDAFVGGGSQNWNVRLSGSKYRTDGISIYPDGDEKDGYENDAYAANLALVVAQNMTIELSRRYYKDKTDLDYGSEFDDPNYETRGEHTLDSGKATIYLTDNWEQILAVSNADDFSKTKDPDASYLDSKITSGIDTIDWQHNFYLQKDFVLTLGYEKRDEKGKSKGYFDKSITNKAVYMNIKQSTESETLTIGGRYDDNDEFGDETTYRIGITEKVAANARFRASYGTAFRAPTLNDLYWPDTGFGAGNPDLDPERSKAWEIGLEQDLGPSSMFSITYFEQKYTDLIEWVETSPFYWQPENVSKAKVKGVETTLQYAGPAWSAKVSHTHLETEDEDGKRLTLRPKDKYFAMLGYFGPTVELSADYTYVSMRYNSPGEHSPIDSYKLVNVYGALKFGKSVKLYARGENVTDEDYELVEGYNTPGEAYYGGIKVEF